MVYGFISSLDDETTKVFFRSKKIRGNNIYGAGNLGELTSVLQSGDVVYTVSCNRFASVRQVYTFARFCHERVKLHLDIDEQQEEAKAYSYKWVPDTGSVMYCMPEKGTRVSLYFPDEDEQNAVAVSCVRENGGSCPNMTDANNKNFANPQGMNMFLQPKQVGLHMENRNQMMNLLDENGISIEAGLKISFLAKEGVEICGKMVNLNSPNVLNIARDPEMTEEEA